mmetsp:Transcript_114762/g.335597  ORF Transcript_114762/g.335597 Transcript_114762/m.335597 type:complete len:527 (+) Transcript_114762:45-1625(+)
MRCRLPISLLVLVGLCTAPSVRGLLTYRDLRTEPATSGLAQVIQNLTTSARCKQKVWKSSKVWTSHGHDIAEPQQPNVPSSPYVTSIPVFYITRGGRREDQFLKLFRDFSPQMNRVAGIDGSNLSSVRDMITDPEETLSETQRLNVTGGVIGCMLSHMQAIHQALASGAEAALILEDDAVPLTPWWPVSLEEFALSLPDGWDASQMQWSANLRKAEVSPGSRQINISEMLQNKSGSHELFERATGWGTAAYLISRKGMRQVDGEVWDDGEQKFRVTQLAKYCRRFSADDCLLGFSDTANAQARRETARASALRGGQTSRASPPYFLHDSLRRKGHRINACFDVLAATTFPSHSMSWMRTPGQDRKELLMFVPAQMGEASVRQMMRNIQHARSTAGPHCCDVFPAFGAEVKPARTAGSPHRKLNLFREHYSDFGEAWTKQYDYVWVLDPEVDITETDVHQVLKAVRDAGAAVAQPLASQSGCYKNCSYGVRDLLSLRAPMFRIDAIPTVLGGTYLSRPQLLLAGSSA